MTATEYVERIEGAVEDPSALIELDTAVAEDTTLPPPDREGLRGRIRRYLDNARQAGEISEADWNPIKHPRTRLGLFADVPDLPDIAPSLPTPGETQIGATPFTGAEHTYDAAAARWKDADLADRFASFEASVTGVPGSFTRQIGMFEGSWEPSYDIRVASTEGESARSMLREDFNQDEVATFTFAEDGPDVEVTISGFDNPDEFARALIQAGLLGANFPRRDSASIWLLGGRDDSAFAHIMRYAAEHGYRISAKPGRATGIG